MKRVLPVLLVALTLTLTQAGPAAAATQTRKYERTVVSGSNWIDCREDVPRPGLRTCVDVIFDITRRRGTRTKLVDGSIVVDSASRWEGACFYKQHVIHRLSDFLTLRETIMDGCREHGPRFDTGVSLRSAWAKGNIMVAVSRTRCSAFDDCDTTESRERVAVDVAMAPDTPVIETFNFHRSTRPKCETISIDTSRTRAGRLHSASGPWKLPQHAVGASFNFYESTRTKVCE